MSFILKIWKINSTKILLFVKMDISVSDDIAGEHKSKTIQGVAGSKVNDIKLIFPTLYEKALNKARRLSLMIDTCVIRYVPQCPYNSSGRVRIKIYDTRTGGVDSKQAEFVFPVTCPVHLTYYGSSYASMKDKNCPWSATYELEESNINSNVHYCKLKAFLKLSTKSNPEEIPFRPPMIDIKSDRFSVDDVDVWHCAPKPRTVNRVTSMRVTNRELGPLGLRAVCSPGRAFSEINSIHSSGPLNTARLSLDVDPGPSASEVGSHVSSCRGVHLTPEELGRFGKTLCEASSVSHKKEEISSKSLYMK